MSFHVVRAGLDHLDLLVPLFDAYRQFYEQASDEARARTFLTNRLTHGESVVFLAVQEGRGVGFTQLYPYFSSVRMRPLWLLNDLFVAPSARKQGVGEALMEAARAWALETGAAQLTLATARDNHNAKRLYEALGYIRDVEFDYYALDL